LALCDARDAALCASSSACGGGGAGEQRLHLRQTGVDEMRRVVNPSLAGEPAARRERRPAHQSRGPDVAEDAPLVANRVGKPSLLEQLVEGGAMRLRHTPADVGDLVLDVRSAGAAARDRGPNRTAQRVGKLEREGIRDVEAVEQPVPDQIEIGRHRRADLRIGAQGFEHATRILVGFEKLPRPRALPHRRNQAMQLLGGAGRDGGRAAHQSQQLRRRDAGPVADVGQEVPRRHDGGGREAHVLVEHLGMMVTAARQMRGQIGVGELVGVDGLQATVRLDRSRLERLVPFLQLLPPEFAPVHLLRPLEALRDLLFRRRPDRLVAEPVDVGHLQPVDQHAVGLGELVSAALEGLRMDFHPVPRRGSREVYGVQLPGPGTRGVEAKVGGSP
jgi:hypothetical protein